VAEPFDWRTFLSLAEELAERNDPASLRSALSRAYYFVYHLALSRAEANAFKFAPGEATHSQLWRLYNESPEPDCRRLGEIARRMKRNRERADYETHFVRVEEEVPGTIFDARQFDSLLSALPARHPSPRSVRR